MLNELEIEQRKNTFLEIFDKYITREGSQELRNWLTSKNSDFFTAPASTKYHSAFRGGLCDHSINVYNCLNDFLHSKKAEEYGGLRFFVPETSANYPIEESIAIVSLLHDLCKVNVYKVSQRNVKDPITGVWKAQDYFEFDDQLPYGHGEKSVYMLSGFMKLTREEAFAIRYHMGFSEENDVRNCGKAFEQFPLAVALSVADTEATYFIEAKKEK